MACWISVPQLVFELYCLQWKMVSEPLNHQGSPWRGRFLEWVFYAGPGNVPDDCCFYIELCPQKTR